MLRLKSVRSSCRCTLAMRFDDYSPALILESIRPAVERLPLRIKAALAL